MEELLDRFFETLEFNLQREFSRYIVKVSQIKGSFYVLIKQPRGKILGKNLKQLFDVVQYLSEKVYKNSPVSLTVFGTKFPYFKLVRCYCNYSN